jgi:hypothetical protein
MIAEQNASFCLTPDPSPIGDGSYSARLYESLLNEVLRSGFHIMPRKSASFPVSGKGRGWGIDDGKTEAFIVNITA